MTRYEGGKNKIGKEIHKKLVALESCNGKTNLAYLEPFVGMAGVLRHFNEGERELYACDANADIVSFWKHLQTDWTPPMFCNAETYNNAKLLPSPDPLRAFYGFGCSYGGCYFMGFAGKYSDRNYAKESYNAVMKVKPLIQNVTFLEPQSYAEFEPCNMLIYCDPPYATAFSNSKLFKTFNSEAFWDTMRKWSSDNIVAISEVSAPSDFIPIWSKRLARTNNTRKNIYRTSVPIDSLYIHETLKR